jgi:hypothetical protein
MFSTFGVEGGDRLPFILSIFGTFWKASLIYGNTR